MFYLFIKKTTVAEDMHRFPTIFRAKLLSSHSYVEHYACSVWSIAVCSDGARWDHWTVFYSGFQVAQTAYFFSTWSIIDIHCLCLVTHMQKTTTKACTKLWRKSEAKNASLHFIDSSHKLALLRILCRQKQGYKTLEHSRFFKPQRKIYFGMNTFQKVFVSERLSRHWLTGVDILEANSF